MTNGPESAPRRSRRAADVPVDSPAGPRERESQQRARDREALRAYKALTETQERRDPEPSLPTRRQLRQQQQRAAAGAQPGTAVPVSSEPADPSPAVSPSAQPGPDTSSAPVPPRRERRRQESTAAPAEQESQHPATDDSSGIAATESPAEVSAAAAAAGTDPNADVEGMSVEQALAARQALEGQARNQVAAMEALQAADPQAVDLELLAQQKALAERAKVLNRRTQAIRKLSEENEQRRPSTGDPSTAHNLAMVTPLEFVSVPGMEHPVMKAPPTSHVPIVTAATAAPAARPLPVVPAPRPASVPRRVPNGATDVRRSRARADAPVSATPESEDAATPIGARSAFGLDPLDVMTAGLGRTRKLRFAAAGVAGLGALALIVGILMIVGRLGS